MTRASSPLSAFGSADTAARDWPTECDVAIAGAGPAGSTLASLLARRGLRVVLLERDRLPRDKLCGEFLAGECRGVLERAGALERVLAAEPALIDHAAFVSTGGRRVRIELGQPSWGLRRRTLDALLFDVARESGACVFDRARLIDVTGPPAARGHTRVQVERSLDGDSRHESLEADLAVLALGRGAHAHGRAAKRGATWAALEMHFRPATGRAGANTRDALRGAVEVYSFRDGYCGINRVDGDLINVCFTVRERVLPALRGDAPGDARALFDACARRSPPLERRLDELDPAEEHARAVARVSLGARRTSGPSALHVGDAAGMIAPLAGAGQAMAIESAARLDALIGAVRAGGQEVTVDLLRDGWDRAWRRAFGRRLASGRALQAVLVSPALSALAAQVCRLTPALPRRLLAATRG